MRAKPTIISLLLFFALGTISGYFLHERFPPKKLSPPPPPSFTPLPPQGKAQEAIKADVLRVIDGDTFEVRAHLWEGLEKTARVRLNHVNAPEKRKRAGCKPCYEEKKLAARAEARVKTLIGWDEAKQAYRPIYLSAIGGGLYDRASASIMTASGVDLATALIEEGLAKPHLEGKRACWCGVASSTLD